MGKQGPQGSARVWCRDRAGKIAGEEEELVEPGETGNGSWSLQLEAGRKHSSSRNSKV